MGTYILKKSKPAGHVFGDIVPKYLWEKLVDRKWALQVYVSFNRTSAKVHLYFL